MIFAITILATALMLSTVAAFYSISGLIAIFPSTVIPIIIMGGTLEISKIVATVWLHKFWHRAGIQFKLYLVPAILILMTITSMGIFGYLSKSHLDQTITVGDSTAQVEILDEKIRTEQDNITASKRALQQMDAQVDQMLGRTTDDRGANRAVQIRKQQAKERKSLQADISTAQKTIAALQAERAPIAVETRKIEAEIGPIRYIAALIYGDNPNADLLERAVRWIIILLVFVFDPLALILILAAEQTIVWSRDDKKPKEEIKQGWHQEWVPDSEDPWRDMDPITDEQFDNIRKAAGVDQDMEMTEHLFDTEEEFFAHGKELAKSIDANEGQLPDNYASTQTYLHTHMGWPKYTDNTGLVPNSTVEQDPLIIKDNSADTFDLMEDLKSKNAKLEAKIAELAATPLTDHVGNAITAPIAIKIDQIDAPDLSISEDYPDSNITAGFGTVFPINPIKGDIYLRVDYLPSKLFKWNGTKWIEIEKTSTDRYSYDEEYIKHLIEKISTGNYDTDLLTSAEEEQIQRYLNDSTNQ